MKGTLNCLAIYDYVLNNTVHISSSKCFVSFLARFIGWPVSIQSALRKSSIQSRDSESLAATDGGTSGRKRSRRRQSKQMMTSYPHNVHLRHQGMLCKMLAPYSSLLNLCLRKGKFAQARKVVAVSVVSHPHKITKNWPHLVTEKKNKKKLKFKCWPTLTKTEAQFLRKNSQCTA